MPLGFRGTQFDPVTLAVSWNTGKIGHEQVAPAHSARSQWQDLLYSKASKKCSGTMSFPSEGHNEERLPLRRSTSGTSWFKRNTREVLWH